MPNKNDAATKQNGVPVSARKPSDEQILHLFQTLIGREPTPEERAQLQHTGTRPRVA